MWPEEERREVIDVREAAGTLAHGGTMILRFGCENRGRDSVKHGTEMLMVGEELHKAYQGRRKGSPDSSLAIGKIGGNMGLGLAGVNWGAGELAVRKSEDMVMLVSFYRWSGGSRWVVVGVGHWGLMPTRRGTREGRSCVGMTSVRLVGHSAAEETGRGETPHGLTSEQDGSPRSLKSPVKGVGVSCKGWSMGRGGGLVGAACACDARRRGDGNRTRRRGQQREMGMLACR